MLTDAGHGQFSGHVSLANNGGFASMQLNTNMETPYNYMSSTDYISNLTLHGLLGFTQYLTLGNLMKSLSIKIFFFTLISFMGFSQGLYDHQQIFYLINSGMSKVIVKGRQTNIWHIDSSAMTVTMHTLVPTLINPTAPKYDDKHSISNMKKYFFNKQGNVDSILIANYDILLRITNPPKMDTIADTTVIIYSYPFLEQWAMNRKKYSIKNGQKRLFSTDYFGYDSQKRLILLIQDEGRVQFFYSYNDQRQIEKETVFDATILYAYNSTGQLISRISDTQKVEYEYNETQLLVRKIVTGNNAEITTYEYE